MKNIVNLAKSFFIILILSGFANVSAQSGWVNPNGDDGQPLLEIWIYGATVPGGASLEAGDEIAVFSGNTLTGLITLTVTPSNTTVWSSHLIAFSKNINGQNLYTPGEPFVLKCYDASESEIFVAYTWGDGKNIDFHNEWWAPTSESAAASSNMTQGAFFPAEGGYSYCYVDATFVAGTVPLVAEVRIDVDEADGLTNIATATVTAGNYTATYADEVYTLLLFAGDEGATDDYTYTITISNSGNQTETHAITVDGNTPGGWDLNVLMDAYGNLDGYVKGYAVPTDPIGFVENATVSITVDGIVYSDNTDGTGYYLIEGIPDGVDQAFTVSYPEHITETFTETITNDNTTTAAVVELDYQQGTIEGEIFDATTINLIDVVTIELWNADLTGSALTTVTTTDGTYSLSYYGGTYSIKVITAGYETIIDYNHVFYPGYIEDGLVYNLLPTGIQPEFDPITGDPNKMWTIKLEFAKFGVNFLVPWDELVLFDTDQAGIGNEPGKRVGTLILKEMSYWQNQDSNILMAYSSFTNGNLGFVTGNNMEFWAYDISHDAIYETPIQWNFSSAGTYTGNVFPDSLGNHVSYLNIYWEGVTGELAGVVTDGGVGIDGVLVEVLNIYTQEVIDSSVTNGDGQYTVSLLDQGAYDIRFSKTGYSTKTVDDVVIIEGQATTLDVTLTSRPSLTWTYVFPPGPNFYFIGRTLETSEGPDILNLFDYGKAVGEEFTAIRRDSWIENDFEPADKIYYDGGWQNSFDWELTEGYQLFYNHVDGYSFDMVGPLADPSSNSIVFPTAGIYYIPYYPGHETNVDDAMTAFAGIFSELDWVMDGEGNRLHHDGGGWIDNIGDLSPLEGYKVKMNGGATLTYPTATKKSSNKIEIEPEYFVYSGGNAADWIYTIYIETDDFEIGDEIAAFCNGVLVGSMVIESDDPWENDLNTFYEAVNGGYNVNTPIELVAYDISQHTDYSVEYEMININSACYPGDKFPAGLDQFSYARVYRGVVKIDEIQIENNIEVYPNPTSGMLNIESSNIINELKVYNIYGALVSVMNVNAKQQQIDVSGYVTGTYLVQLYTNTGVITKRVIIN